MDVKAEWEWNEVLLEYVCSYCGAMCRYKEYVANQHKNGIIWGIKTPDKCTQCGAEMEK